MVTEPIEQKSKYEKTSLSEHGIFLSDYRSHHRILLWTDGEGGRD